ncbi:MAG: hypothetical protein LCH69_05665 [Proteobacteria bacterium]|nr:hypothetical protein [Pseudomonadota bacterium]
MPALVRMYIRHVLIGYAIAAVFVAALLWLNVGNLWHLVSTSPVGWIAAAMLFFANGIVFSGVQFAIAVMQMAEPEGKRGGGTRAPLATSRPAIATSAAGDRTRQGRAAR